jgi:hypothetical protein
MTPILFISLEFITSPHLHAHPLKTPIKPTDRERLATPDPPRDAFPLPVKILSALERFIVLFPGGSPS